jgi:hypothetical protein
MDGFVCHLDMKRVTVGIGIDRYGPDAHAPRRLDDTAGDLAAVRDQDFREHARLPPASDQTAIAAVYGTSQLSSTNAKVGNGGAPEKGSRFREQSGAPTSDQLTVRPDGRAVS